MAAWAKFKQEQHVILLAAVTGMLTITFACLLEWWFPVLELFAHFTLQYIALCVILACWAWRAGFHGRAWLFSFCLLVHMAEVTFVGIALGKPPPESSAHNLLHILQVNMFAKNHEPEAAMQVLLAEGRHHDLLVLGEYPVDFLPPTKTLLAAIFPYSYYWKAKDGISYNMAVFSKSPMKVTVQEGSGPRSDYLHVMVPDKGAEFITMHSMTPGRPAQTHSRHRQQERVFRVIAAADKSAFVIGDFNQTVYATKFQLSLLRNNVSLVGFPDSMLPTWPAYAFAAPLRIPIDNIVVNRHAAVVERQLVAMPGSDHYAVSNTLAIH